MSRPDPARAGGREVELPPAWLRQYLAFGFVPTVPPGQDPLFLVSEWSRPPRRRAEDVWEADLVREGVDALKKTMAAAAEASMSGDQVVFLSGGIDSRAILGGLLEMYTTREVVAATFGMPGESDFDFAGRVAAVAGVRHETLESFSVPWSTQALVDSVRARGVPFPNPFGQRYLSYLLHQRIGKENVFWDGLCGDAVSGFWSPFGEAEYTWDEAVAAWRDFHLHPQWQELAGPDFDPASVLPEDPFCSFEVLSYADQLDIGLRQGRRTSTRLLRDFTIRTPFLVGPWLDFILSAPEQYRQGQRLYMEVVKAAYPRLFSLPLTTLGGGALTETPRTRTLRRIRRGVRRRLGLVRPGPRGANTAIRSRYLADEQIRELVRDNLEDLRARGIVDGLDVASVLGADGPGAQDALLVLLGVELNLKALARTP